MSAADAFFDTNVLLYLISADAAKADRAEALVASGGVISVQVLNEFLAVATRKGAMSIAEVRDALAAVRAVCTVQPLDLQTHLHALDIAERYHFHIYDALIVAAAQLAGCSCLYSEDLADGQIIEALTIRNPFTPPG